MYAAEALPLVQDWAAIKGLPPADPEKVMIAWMYLKALALLRKLDVLPSLEETYSVATVGR